MRQSDYYHDSIGLKNSDSKVGAIVPSSKCLYLENLAICQAACLILAHSFSAAEKRLTKHAIERIWRCFDESHRVIPKQQSPKLSYFWPLSLRTDSDGSILAEFRQYIKTHKIISYIPLSLPLQMPNQPRPRIGTVKSAMATINKISRYSLLRSAFSSLKQFKRDPVIVRRVTRTNSQFTVSHEKNSSENQSEEYHIKRKHLKISNSKQKATTGKKNVINIEYQLIEFPTTSDQQDTINNSSMQQVGSKRQRTNSVPFFGGESSRGFNPEQPSIRKCPRNFKRQKTGQSHPMTITSWRETIFTDNKLLS